MRQNASELVRRAQAGGTGHDHGGGSARGDAGANQPSGVATVGRQPRARVMGLLIAAPAHAHGATVYTRNAADLVGLEDILAIVSI